MNEQEYIDQRLQNQIEWYSDKSSWNQRWYKWLRIVEVICASSIPFGVSYVTNGTVALKIVVGSLGVFVVVVTGVVALYKFQENWIQYRITSETLKHEKFLFLTKTEPYNIENPFPLFVKRVESLISKENSSWSQYVGVCEQMQKQKKDG